jgi:flagellar protein FliL
VADEAPKDAIEELRPEGGLRSYILYALVFINMLVVGGVGFMVYKWRKEEAHSEKGKMQAVLNGAIEDQKTDIKKKDEEYVGVLVPLETFLVNLAGARGNKLLKVNMELEVEDGKVVEEIEKRKPQIRDIVIILLSSKTLEQVQAKEGKDQIRNEIRDRLNSFLVKGRIKQVLFTEFIYH